MGTPNTPTLRDVATAAGVAVSTVSYALNGKGRVDAVTRAKVQKVADELGYTANRAAQSLRSGRTATLGLMLPAPDELSSAEYLNFDWYWRIARSATQVAFDADHSLLLLPSMKDPNGLRRIALDGVIVVDPIANDARIDVLQRIGMPSVAIGPGSTDQFGYTVCPDLVSATDALLNHLTERGATNILMLAPGPSSNWTRATTHAYVEWCNARGIPARMSNPLGLHTGPRTVEQLVIHAYATARDALTSANPPDAIVSLILGCATAASRAAHDLGLSIPRDILIAQDSDEPALTISDPPITAIELFPDELAEVAVEALLALINGGQPSTHGHTRSELRIRTSTDRTVSP